jgi:thiol-disulfide isomerase/thioredoxin
VNIDSLVVNYWNNFDFADTAQVISTSTEQLLADYLSFLPHVSDSTVQASISDLTNKVVANQKTFSHFTDLLEKYLYDPNSPYRNEEFYAVVLEQSIASPQVNEIYKIRPRAQMEDINRNRQGKKAANFTYTLPDGRKEKLYDIASDYTLIFFYNPDCSDCKRVKEYLQSSEHLSKLQNAGRLQVLAIYPDENSTTWENYQSEIPGEWINGRDATQAINNKRIYTLRAIPSLYLLDKNKTVLLKDCTTQQLEQELQTIRRQHESILTPVQTPV